MSRRAWVTFASVQLVGVVCVWSGPRILSAPGPVVFLSGLVLLAPGDVLSLLTVEKLAGGPEANALRVRSMEKSLVGAPQVA